MKDWRGSYSKYKDFFLNSYTEYTKKEEIKMFLEVILSLFVSAFFIFFALQPTILTVSELLRTIKAKEQVIVKMDEKIKNLETAKALFSSESAKIELVNFAVPDNPAPDTFSQQIAGLSGQQQTNLATISVDPIVIVGKNANLTSRSDTDPLPESANAMSFNISAFAPTGFPSAASFISSLSNLRRSLKIDKVSLSSSINEGVQSLILAVTGRGAYLGETPAKTDDSKQEGDTLKP